MTITLDDTPDRIAYGPLIGWVLTAAFALSVAHTIQSEIADTADPGFRINSPTVWVFYGLGFGAAVLARRAGRRAQVGLVAYLVVLLGVGVLYYPTTFTEERQTVFGWIENDVYLGLLMIATALSVLRLGNVEVGEVRESAVPSSAGAASANVHRDEPIDVHDMVVVHRAFRREFRIVPDLVRAVAPGDTARADVVGSHLRLCLDGLHLHHSSEDDLLWPLLLDRCPSDVDVIERQQQQHAAIEEGLDRIELVLARWQAEARPAVGVELAAAIEQVHDALVCHLDDEERSILPLAARYLSVDEWAAIGQAGVSKMSRTQLPLMFGMVMEDATPEERSAMLGILPAPVRLLLRTWGAAHYSRYVTAVRG